MCLPLSVPLVSTYHLRLAAIRFAAAVAIILCLPTAARAQSSQNVLLVVNESSPESVTIGDYYAKARSVPSGQIVRLKAPVLESISRETFQTSIETPIAEWLSRYLLQDQILFIVLTKGIPLRVEGTAGQVGTIASVDSELTLLYRKMTGLPVSIAGRVDNPYYLNERPVSEARRFTRSVADIYLVTRLDGFSADDVLKLIDRAGKPVREGRIVLDQKSTMIDRGGDQWLAEAAKRLADAGQAARVTLDATRAVVATTDPVLGYFSWGSNDPANQRRQMGLTYAPGAIGGMFVSTDGRTFREPPATWKPAPAGSASGGQTLAADLIREGITGISASVAEPYLDAIVRPQILFPAYLSGYTMAEAYYLAMPYLSWQTIIIGDPLCAPFLAAPLPQERLHSGINTELSLPAIFGERRLGATPAPGLNRDAIKLYLKALSLQAQHKPPPEVEATLERAADMEPRLLAAHVLLAEMATSRGSIDQAITHYRLALQVEPNHLAVLNNLAYALADKKNAATEALPLAEKAYRLSNQAPIVADTLGWIHFKLDHVATALPLLERAAAALPGEVDVLVHAATVNLASNNMERAKTLLDAAVKANPAAAGRDDVKALRARIK
ncbi:MAG TPA: TIGR03790 family protein [Pirellulaceae bacterium]|nr:TIGR03790 family protein [Pirellulaceae bacterium]